MPTYTKTWDETKPAGSRALSLGDDDIREFKYAIRERLGTDHYLVADETGITTIGYHKWCTFIEAADIGTGATGLPILGAQTVSGVPELTYTTEGNVDVQLTDGSYIKHTSLKPGSASEILVTTGGAAAWSSLSTILTGSSVAKVKVYTYSGDGNATQAVTGVGFQPTFLLVYARVHNVSYVWIKTSQDTTYAKDSQNNYLEDQIVSLDADGFTLGDGTGSTNYLNVGGRGYSYIALAGV